MKKLGNARALDTASLLGGLMRDHWVSMAIYRQLNPNSSSALEGHLGLSRIHEEPEKGHDDRVRNTCWRQVIVIGHCW